MSLIERMARAIYETQDNPVPWDSETLSDWRRDYEREKARAALAVVRDHDRGAVDALRWAMERVHPPVSGDPSPSAARYAEAYAKAKATLDALGGR